MRSKREINQYLFYEFGVAVEETGDEAHITDDWPFELTLIGVIQIGDHPIQVFSFTESDEHYDAVSSDSLTYYPAAGLSLDQLRLQLRGGEWISRYDPVDLNTARIGDRSVPATATRRSAIDQLCEHAFGVAIPVIIHEGLYLTQAQHYFALVERTDSKRTFLLGTTITPREISYSEASAWRRLAIGVGELLETGIIR
jgi:hypothetical protein